MSGPLILAIAVVVAAAVAIARLLRQRTRPAHWNETFLSVVSVLMVGLFLVAREAGPSGQAGDILMAALLAAAVLLLVRATLERRRRLRDDDEGEPQA